MKILVGLGNPGPTYRWSRHNIGFQVIDRVAKKHHISISSKRFQGQYGKGLIGYQGALLFKPLTFMNLSGSAVKKVVDFYRAEIEDLLIIHDDLDLVFGTLRIRRWGGDGGHQGIRSIAMSMGANNFLRLKVGIGRPPAGVDPADYVLSPFEGAERQQLEQVLSRAAECATVLILEGIETAMNRYHFIPPCQSP